MFLFSLFRKFIKKASIKKESPPTNQHSSGDPNKRTDHSGKPFTVYLLIDSRSVCYMSSNLCTEHTIGYLWRVSLLASFIGSGNSGEDMSHFICQQKKSTSSLLFPTSNALQLNVVVILEQISQAKCSSLCLQHCGRSIKLRVSEFETRCSALTFASRTTNVSAFTLAKLL